MRAQDVNTQRENHTGGPADPHQGRNPTYSVQECLQRPNLLLLIFQQEADVSGK